MWSSTIWTHVISKRPSLSFPPSSWISTHRRKPWSVFRMWWPGPGPNQKKRKKETSRRGTKIQLKNPILKWKGNPQTVMGRKRRLMSDSRIKIMHWESLTPSMRRSSLSRPCAWQQERLSPNWGPILYAQECSMGKGRDCLPLTSCRPVFSIPKSCHTMGMAKTEFQWSTFRTLSHTFKRLSKNSQISPTFWLLITTLSPPRKESSQQYRRASAQAKLGLYRRARVNPWREKRKCWC